MGHALRETLPVLLDAVLGRVSVADAAVPLGQLIRIRAVQDLTPGKAVGFLFELYPLLRETVPAEELEDRVNQLALVAFDLYMRCREQVHAIQLKDLRRRAAVLERLEVRS